MDHDRGGEDPGFDVAITPAPAIGVDHEYNTTSARILLLWDELPAWQQDNQHIRSGYRPALN